MEGAQRDTNEFRPVGWQRVFPKRSKIHHLVFLAVNPTMGQEGRRSPGTCVPSLVNSYLQRPDYKETKQASGEVFTSERFFTGVSTRFLIAASSHVAIKTICQCDLSVTPGSPAHGGTWQQQPGQAWRAGQGKAGRGSVGALGADDAARPPGAGTGALPRPTMGPTSPGTPAPPGTTP